MGQIGELAKDSEQKEGQKGQIRPFSRESPIREEIQGKVQGKTVCAVPNVPDKDATPTALWKDMPDYPKEPCYTCGGSDFWPDFEGKRFVCSRCHPQPQEIDMEI
jgi:hypothetical protein